jgi:hypothetical protein
MRFMIGGAIVSFFSILGDLFKPKSFAGLFSAAPSVALASLWLAFEKHGGSYASIEGLSMILGALALYLYSHTVSWVLLRYKFASSIVAACTLVLWFVAAFGLWALLLE